MEPIVDLTPEEQKFFDTKGAVAPPEEEPKTEPEKKEPAKAEPAAKIEKKEPEKKEPEKHAAPDLKKLEENYENVKRALNEQRFLHKTQKDEIERERQRASKLEDTFQKFVSRFVEKKPDFEQDPASHLKTETEEINRKVDELTKSAKEQRELQTQQQQFDQFRNAVSTQEAEFLKTTPDYADALTFLRQLRQQDLTDLGVSQEQIAQALQTESMTIAANALRAGKNPAEVAYGIAKRYGYKKAEPEKKDEPKKEIEKIETIKKGQDAAKNVPTGAGEGTDVTLEALANLSEDEIDRLVQDEKWWKKNISSVRSR